MYSHGQGVSRNYGEAVRWYRKSADRGDATAQANLACMYSEGHGVRQDYDEAVRWYRKAAGQGDADARHALRVMYCKWQGMLLGHWISVVAILLGLPVILVPLRRWGRATWVPAALTSGVCAAMVVHELAAPLWWGFTGVLAVALPACCSAIYAVAAVVDAARGSKRGVDVRVGSSIIAIGRSRISGASSSGMTP
jgi:hypothetical protein